MIVDHGGSGLTATTWHDENAHAESNFLSVLRRIKFPISDLQFELRERGYAVLETPTLITADEAIEIYERFRTTEVRELLTRRRDPLVREITARFRHQLQTQVIDPLSPTEPLGFGYGSFVAIAPGTSHTDTHSDINWINALYLPPGLEPTEVVDRGEYVEGRNFFRGRPYCMYDTESNAKWRQVATGKIVLLTGQERAYYLDVRATPHRATRVRENPRVSWFQELRPTSHWRKRHQNHEAYLRAVGRHQ